jgi:hypothetical protein
MTTTETRTRMRAYSTIPWPLCALRIPDVLIGTHLLYDLARSDPFGEAERGCV